jgi:hypothetical protein
MINKTHTKNTAEVVTTKNKKRFNMFSLKVIDEFNTPIIDITGKPRRIKDAMKQLDIKFNGEN